MQKVIVTCFAGRKEFMELQLRYMIAILEKFEFVERYDIWNFSWSAADKDWVDSLGQMHPKIRVCRAPFDGIADRAGDLASKQFAHFFTEAYLSEEYRDHLFVKIDDDVVFIDVDRFEEFIKLRIEQSDPFLVSADVINNDFQLKNPSHLHRRFLATFAQKTKQKLRVEDFSPNKRLSINFVSWRGKDLPHIAREFSNGVGAEDEWRMCHVIPTRLGRSNVIVQNYMVAHLAFGKQLKKSRVKRFFGFEPKRFMRQYVALANKLLGVD